MPTDLTESELSAFASDHPDWVREGESITRVFVFKDFNASLGFVVRVGAASEVADHHPDIDIRWNKVTLSSELIPPTERSTAFGRADRCPIGNAGDAEL